MEEKMMTMRSRWDIPTFGHWEHSGELHITQYFESARQAGLLRRGSFRNDLFEPPPSSLFHHYPQARRSSALEKRQQAPEQMRQSQRKVCDVVQAARERTARRNPKAVDEDLYKIPPELLSQRWGRRRRSVALWGLWRKCRELNCIS